jgi:hypothetical protein
MIATFVLRMRRFMYHEVTRVFVLSSRCHLACFMLYRLKRSLAFTRAHIVQFEKGCVTA